MAPPAGRSRPPTPRPPGVGRRIHVIGNSGSGKSTVSRRLAAANGVPRVELDGDTTATQARATMEKLLAPTLAPVRAEKR